MKVIVSQLPPPGKKPRPDRVWTESKENLDWMAEENNEEYQLQLWDQVQPQELRLISLILLDY